MDQSLFIIVSALTGLLIGSFLNVVILRTRSGKGLGGRSHCPGCGALIRWFDNVPLASFAWLRGKCRACRKRISFQYPLVEAATAFLFALSVWVRLSGGEMDREVLLMIGRDWFVAAVLVAVFVYDMRWYEIPDRFSIPGIVTAAAFSLALGAAWRSLALAAAVGGGFFLVQYAVSRGRWIGGGDIRLGVLMGAVLGWPQVVAALFLAYVGGAIIALGLVAAGRKSWGEAVPFGTFLVPATAVTLFWGNELIHWYLSYLF